jgi:hypothetical protein
MDAHDLFLPLHERLGRAFEETCWGGLADADRRRRPRVGVNSLAWTLYHTVRVEDAAANLLVAGGRQVLHEGGWGLGLDAHDVGKGMTDDEVDDFGARIDLAALRAYSAAVWARTRAVATGLPTGAWDEPLGLKHVEAALASADVYGPRATSAATALAGRTKGWVLAQYGLEHPTGHLAEAAFARGLLEAAAQ